MVFLTDSRTEFSYIEYQAIVLSLAGIMCVSLWFLEVSLRRFQVLPLFFPTMFNIRQRRFYIFEVDISDGELGKRIRGHAKILLRMTTCLVLAYLWQHCVMQTHQSFGNDFPRTQCERGYDCFASEMHFLTFFSRQHVSLDCTLPKKFENSVVVSCIRFIPPTASDWLKNLAIANSVVQLTLKSYEVIVSAASRSARLRMLLAGMNCTTVIVFLVLFFTGTLTTFLDSWLSFVMTLALPCFLYCTWKSGSALEMLYKFEDMQIMSQLEQNFDIAFGEIESMFAQAEEEMKRTSTGTSGENTSQAYQMSSEKDKGLSVMIKSFWKNKFHQLPAALKLTKGRAIIGPSI